MKNPIVDPSRIKGWSVDADRENDPTYPMKVRNDDKQASYSWERPSQQRKTVEVLRSIERPNLTAVFGTSTPPAGLSGAIRRLAFKYSESSYGHWLPLMLADRIGVVEGLLEDLSNSRVPNIPAERGWKAEWKHNREALTTRIAVGAAVAVVAYLFLRRRNRP